MDPWINPAQDRSDGWRLGGVWVALERVKPVKHRIVP